ncbi:MAG TPA: methyltransferase domain-containing protein [Thermoanaerobaculia bacterium]|nr:methyltransferase domain-containing protein [Thermoanaerobaculia bacterium]
MTVSHPNGVLPAVRQLDFVCPSCRGELSVASDAYRCDSCARDYPVLLGIPDFRLFPDPYLAFEDDAAKAEMVASLLDSHTLETLLERYWSVSDVTPPELRKLYIRSAMLSERRSEGFLNRLPANGNGSLLDVGSGTGGLLLAAARRGFQVAGVDIAMRWLQVSRRRFMDAGKEPPALVCACAESLPFRDEAFDRVTSISTLEFASEAESQIAEAARILKSDGAHLVSTVNRHSLAADPYAYLRFVGFLPRRWQAQYVGWRRSTQWRIRELSLSELDGLARRSFRMRDYYLPDVDELALAAFPASTRMQVRLYRKAKALPVFGSLLKRFGPGWEAVLRDKIAKRGRDGGSAA